MPLNNGLLLGGRRRHRSGGHQRLTVGAASSFLRDKVVASAVFFHQLGDAIQTLSSVICAFIELARDIPGILQAGFQNG
ncbi:hypothetical protein LAD77_29765 [Klebsiella pneumoniae]|nr:hypothetical protein [Klebsiella pneumoniae]